jgi:16S rRNA (adenine1518-N6/adenine1519-N6)-dimethyltransferase
MKVRAKKHLGQHFLKDESIAERIADGLDYTLAPRTLEIGPGTGVLTKYILKKKTDTYVVEIDTESVAYLRLHYIQLSNKIIEADFLKENLESHLSYPFNLIGNFPYNISTQILFKALELKNHIPQIVGMFQKEVAERICADPGSKVYGIISVLLQAFYKCEYLFTVSETVFSPPPKVKSGVIRLTRNDVMHLSCDEALFTRVVKTAFNQRRKTLRNALKSLNLEYTHVSEEILQLRAERLSVQDFIALTISLEKA